MNPRIFREYDIRGLVDQDLTDDTLWLIGRSLATYLFRQGKGRGVVGRDGRLSSPRFRDHLVQGMVTGGLEVVDIGLCPTPVFYFSLFHLDSDGGAMITGSHNPPEFNGLKVCSGKETLYGEQIQELRRIIESRNFTAGRGSISYQEIIPAYRKYLLENIRLQRKIKVVIDSGNGTGGLVAPKILRDLGCEVNDLYSEVDGRFPNHHPGILGGPGRQSKRDRGRSGDRL